MSVHTYALAMVLGISLISTSVEAKKKLLVTREEIGPYPKSLMEPVQAAAQSYLKDPASATYELGALYPAYCKKGSLEGKGIAWKGWALNVMINARNSFGGYAGGTPFTFLFSGDTVVRIVEGENFGAYGPSKGMLGLDGGAGVCEIIID